MNIIHYTKETGGEYQSVSPKKYSIKINSDDLFVSTQKVRGLFEKKFKEAYKNPKDNVLSFKKYFLIILICIFSLGVLMLLLALFFIGTDYMRTVIDNVIFAMFLTFILILPLLIILIFIVYKIWAYIWNKKTDSRNFRKKSSIRIRLCNKSGKRHE